MRRLGVVLVLAVGVFGCGGPVVEDCSSSCGPGQRCETKTGLCVKDELPAVSLGAIPNLLTVPSVTVRGTTSDDLGVVRGEAFFEGQTPVAFTVTGDAFSVELATPALDSAEAKLTVRVYDTGAQMADVSVTTVVDTVGPTVQLAHPDELIGGPSVRVTGSVRDGSGGVTLVQADFGSGPVTATLGADGAWTVQLAPPMGRDGVPTPITVTAKDTYGNQSTSTLHVTLDTAGPAFTLTRPAGTVGGLMATVAGTVSDVSGAVTGVTVRFDGLAQDIPVSGGAFSASVTLPQGLDAETRPVTFSALDRFGNQGTATFDVTIDTRGPLLTLDGPAVLGMAGELFGTATDASPPVTDVTVSVEGGAGPTPVDSFTNGTWRLATTFGPGLDAVSRSVTVSARDAHGNLGTLVGEVTVDTVPPVGSITAPAANARLRGSSVTVSGMVSDSTSVRAVEVDFGDGQGFRAATVSGSNWTVSVPLSPTEDDVVHVVTARFTDGVGNQSTVSRTVTVDNVGPSVTVTAPAAGTVVGGAATTLAVTVTATDPSGVTAVSVNLGSGAVFNATRQGSTSTWTATVPLPAGQDFVTLPVHATATDAAGNTSFGAGSVIVDNVAPVLTITAPAPNQVFNRSHFTASGNVTISWTVTDGDPQARVTSVGGTAISSGTSTQWPTATTDDYRSYDLPVVAADRMSNTTTQAATFIVDRVAPTVVITPADGTRNVDPRRVTLTFSEEMAGAADPLVLTPASAAPAGAWQGTGRRVFQRSGLEAYTVFTASVAPGVTDRAGNPVAAATSRFHTSAQLPMNSAAVTGSVWAYDVASDPDGLPMVLVVTQVNSTSYSYSTFEMNGRNGQFVSWDFAPTDQYSVAGYQAYAWRTVNADLTATPIRGAWQDGTERSLPCLPSCTPRRMTRRAYAIGSVTPTVDLFGNLLPSPPLNPGDGTAALGFFNNQNYTRAPDVTHGLGLEPARVAPGSVRWNVAANPTLNAPANTSASIWVSSYRCATYGVFPPRYNCFPVTSQVVSDASVSATWARNSSSRENLSLATAEDGCTLLSYPSVSAGRRIARIIDNNSRVPCAPGYVCPVALETTFLPAPTADFVVGRGLGTTLLGVGTAGGGTQLYQTSDCGNTWTPVGAAVSGAAEAKPAVVGTRPAFFYVDASRTLRVFVP